MVRSRTHVLMAAAVVFGSATVALAQTATQPRDPNMPDPKSVPAEKVGPPVSGSSSSSSTVPPSENLSKKLEATEGVIKPPVSADQEIVKPAPVPNPGTTIVIPPAGEPGGNQNFQPK